MVGTPSGRTQTRVVGIRLLGILNSKSLWVGHYSELEATGAGSNRAPIGGKNVGDFGVFFVFFNGILIPFWGFNYSKMAN